MTKLIFLCVFLAYGSLANCGDKYGDWSVNKEVTDLQVANTKNATGDVIGIICTISKDTCNAYIALNKACDVGDIYPMMINSPVGASVITTVCVQIGGETFHFINEFGAAKSAFESGGDIGFALPLLNGNFRSVRFSTRGGTASIKDAMTPPAKLKPVNEF